MISMNLSDVRKNDKERSQLAEQMAAFERENGKVETIPIVPRGPDGYVELVINAEKKAAQTEERKKKLKVSDVDIHAASERIREKMKAHGIRQQSVADILNWHKGRLNNTLNGAGIASMATIEKIEGVVDSLAKDLPTGPKRTKNGRWKAREEIKQLMKDQKITAYRIAMETGLLERYVGKALRGDLEPHPERARMIERFVYSYGAMK